MVGAWMRLGADGFNVAVTAVFEKLFMIMRFDMHGFKTTAFYRDNSIRFMSMMDSIGLSSKRADVIFT